MFEAEADDEDPYRQRRARRMLETYDAGTPVRDTPFPVQAVRFDDDLTLVLLGGEVVVDRITSYNVCYTKLLRHRRILPETAP